MGTTLTSIHAYSKCEPDNCGFSFRSFSDGWYTCTDDFSDKSTEYIYKAAVLISKKVSVPILFFSVFDSDEIYMAMFKDGKLVSRYSSDETTANKKIYSIPEALGYKEEKRRLSNILSCTDTKLTISMLEEYFGVCLLYTPELDNDISPSDYSRDDSVYRKYMAAEKALCGKAAPMEARLVTKFNGKIFCNEFTAPSTEKPHCFLIGYRESKKPEYSRVRFTGKEFCEISEEEFESGRIPKFSDPRFSPRYGSPLTFSELAPSEWHGKTVELPSGYLAVGFLSSGELLLADSGKILVMDIGLKVVSKLRVKGDVADVVNDHILTYTGDSFCGYCYEPKAQVFIYEIVRHK